MGDYDTNGYGHGGVEDYYDDDDDFIDDGDLPRGEASDVEEEEVEPPKPSKEEQEFLSSVRGKLKEEARRRAQKQLANVFGRTIYSTSSQVRPPPGRDRFGSFFGPSQTVIASRVLEESRSIQDAQNIKSRVPRPSGKSVQQSSKAKPSEQQRPPKVVSEEKKKAQALKVSRDYSFLLSDSPDAPVPKEQTASKTSTTPKSSTRTSEASTSQPARLSAISHGAKNSSIVHRPVQKKVGPTVGTPMNKERQLSTDQKKMMNGVRNPNRKHANTAVVNKAPARVVSDLSSRKNALSNASVRKNLPNNPSVRKNPLNDPSTRKPSVSGPSVRRPLVNEPSLRKPSVHDAKKNSTTVKPHSFQSHYPEQKLAGQSYDRAQAAPKHSGSSSRPQSSRPISKNGPTRKRPFEDEDEDDPSVALQMLRKMTGYDPNKFSRQDDDDSDMEASFDAIMREEKRSSRIAREEDERELQLQMEEDRRKAERKKQRFR